MNDPVEGVIGEALRIVADDTAKDVLELMEKDIE